MHLLPTNLLLEMTWFDKTISWCWENLNSNNVIAVRPGWCYNMKKAHSLVVSLQLGGTWGLCRPAVLFRPCNISGLICSRCCSTARILCRNFSPAVAVLHTLPPQHAGIRSGHGSGVAMSLQCHGQGVASCSNEPNEWVMGAFES